MFFLFFISNATPSVVASANFFDDFFNKDISKWDFYSNGQAIGVSTSSGVLSLSSGTTQIFPYVRSKIDPFFGLNNFEVEVKLRFPSYTPWGDGIVIGYQAPENDIPGGSYDLKKAYFIWLWGQSNANELQLWVHDCPTENYENCVNMRRVYSDGVPNDWMILKIRYVSAIYSVSLQIGTGAESIIYTSTHSLFRPHAIWFGNPDRDPYGNSNPRTALDIDYIKVSSLDPGALKPVIILPGSGASWDFGAILNGTAGTNWQIPSFVTLYKNLIDSLKNVGYVEGENLFVFGYDWRKGLNNLADDLSGYINGLIAAGEIGADDKIDFIGHSYGGLVARTYGQRTGTGKIDKIVTAGSPHQGLIDAYGIWEGATIWNGDVCQNFALRLTTRANQRLGENELDTIRRLAPGFKDVLPTFDFLKKNGVLVPSASLSQRNQTLIELNTDKALIDGVLWANGGTGNQTIRFVNVTDRDWLDRSFGLWEDGKPIADSPFENTNDGDRAVLASSATNLFSNQATFPADHGGIIGDQSPLEEIFTQLGLESDLVSTTPIADTCRRVFTTFLRSPGTLRVCDQTGICNESLGVYMPSEKLFFIPEYDGQPLNVSVEANGETGHYRLDVGNIDEGGADWDDVRGNLLSPTQTDNYAVVSDGEMTIAGGTGEEARSFDEDVNSLNGLIPNWDKKKLAIARSGSQSLHKRIIAIRQLRELLSKLAIKAHKNNRPDQIEAIIDVWMDIDDLAESVIGSGNTTKAVVLNANINQVERYKTLAGRLLKNSSSYYAGTFYTLFSERFTEAKEIRTSQRDLSLDKTLSARYLLLTALGVR